MKRMIVAVLVVALVGTAGLALAQGWGRGPGYGPAYPPNYGPRGDWGAGLNLTPEQVQKMQALQDKFFKETLPLRNELQAKALELRTLWAQASPDQTKIMAKQKEINALREQLQEKGTQFRLEARNILTPEQQAQLGSYGPGFGPGYGMMGGFGPGYGMMGGYGHGYGMGYGRGYGMGYGFCPRW